MINEKKVTNLINALRNDEKNRSVKSSSSVRRKSEQCNSEEILDALRAVGPSIRHSLGNWKWDHEIEDYLPNSG